MHLFWPESDDWKRNITTLREKEPLTPFHPAALSFVQDLSKKLIRLRHAPELVALGFWLRKSHIQQMKTLWEKQTKNKCLKARGTVFHLAPSNVDAIFVYSWLLSLLAGNRNIIRISSKTASQNNELLMKMIKLLRKAEHEVVGARTILLTYGHDDNLTAFLSEQCHTRVVWGGDATVKAIRRIPLAPLANELVFPDRFSLTMLNAKAVLLADKQEFDELLKQFYNDSFWFDQMACSSPRLMIWEGRDKDIRKAQVLFWNSFERVILEKGYKLTAATQMKKLTTGLWLATEDEADCVLNQPTYTTVSFSNIPKVARERHCGGGLFYECSISSMSELSSMISDKDQTMTYFGFDKEELIQLVSLLPTRGIDRIVPIGQALDFNETWDGQSFLQSFTREVVII